MMTISNLIKVLKKYMDEYGDMPLGFLDQDSSLTSIEHSLVIRITNDEVPGYEEHMTALTGDYEVDLTTE